MASRYANAETPEQKAERIAAYKEREEERRKHNEEGWRLARERTAREKEEKKEKIKEKKGKGEDEGRPTEESETKDAMRKEVASLRISMIKVMKRIEDLERRLGTTIPTQNRTPTPTGKGTWAQVAGEANVGNARKEEEKRRKANEKRIKGEEQERVSRQRGVIEIISDSQTERNLEGEDLVKMVEEAGVAREEIESIRMIRGRMRVKVRNGEEDKIVERLNKAGLGEIKAAARQMESWVGLVVYGIERKWNREGGMAELREWFEKGWKTKLMKEPKWLADPKDWRGHFPTAPVVIHVARIEDREKMCEGNALRYVDEEGYTVSRSISKWGVQIFKQRNRDKYMAIGRCSTCRKVEHQWGNCPTRGDRKKSRCGICAEMGHTAYEHKCNTEGCKVTRGACMRHEETESLRWKCTECGDKHMVKDCKLIMVAR